VAELQDATSVLVDLLSWGLEETDETAALREQAVGMVGDTQVALDSLRAVVVRHPELDIKEWDDATAEGYHFGQ
ncbi:hypothetical protein BRC90_06825, partial [Halobacteriales archaeon QS_4_69_34]